MFYKKTFLSLFITATIFIFISQIALATCPTGQVDCSGTCQTGTTCNNSLPNPLTGVDSPQVLIGKVIVAALGVVGSLALLMFIYGGFVWMTAAGNQEMVTRGRNVLIWATIGLIIIFSSYAIVKFVFQGVGAPIT